MASALEQAIDALSDPDVALSAALRRLYVVARRIGSTELAATITAEINGYGPSDPVPAYRTPGGLRVSVRFDGYGGSYDHLHLGKEELPDVLSGALADIVFREPVAELEALTTADEEKDPRLELSLGWVGAYRSLAAENKVPRFQMMQPSAAFITLPRTHLRGLLDRLRAAALELALDLEQVSTDAGSPSGPTVHTNADLRAASAQFVQITAGPGSVVNVGDANSSAVGDHATSTVLNVGDVAGLVEAASTFLSSEGRTEFEEALSADDNEAGEQTRSFLSRVRGGGYLLATGIGTNAAYDGLLELVRQVFPSFS